LSHLRFGIQYQSCLIDLVEVGAMPENTTQTTK